MCGAEPINTSPGSNKILGPKWISQESRRLTGTLDHLASLGIWSDSRRSHWIQHISQENQANFSWHNWSIKWTVHSFTLPSSILDSHWPLTYLVLKISIFLKSHHARLHGTVCGCGRKALGRHFKASKRRWRSYKTRPYNAGQASRELSAPCEPRAQNLCVFERLEHQYIVMANDIKSFGLGWVFLCQEKDSSHSFLRVGNRPIRPLHGELIVRHACPEKLETCIMCISFLLPLLETVRELSCFEIKLRLISWIASAEVLQVLMALGHPTLKC